MFRHSVLVSILWLICAVASAAPTSSYKAIPPFLQVNTPMPNVLVVLDNSNSMDEDVTGRAVGSDDPTSRSEIARNAVESMIDTFGSQLRMGLMAYRQSSIASRELHNGYYYVSYNPDTWDEDNLDWFTPRDNSTNTRRAVNPTDSTDYIYYDKTLPFYSGTVWTWPHCYSTNFQERTDPTPPVADVDVNINLDNPYTCRENKTSDLDLSPDGISNDALAVSHYSGDQTTATFTLTDSDVAEGFYQIGAELVVEHVGKAWLSTTAPGGGMLHVAVADPGTSQTAALKAKLAISQFSTATDTPLRNAGFTPLYSTLVSAKQYYQGSLSSTYAQTGVSRTSPISYECQRSFVVLVTDGLPTEDPNGDGDFITPVADAATSLRTTSATVDGSAVSCDVQTFVLGFALPQGQQGALDPVAVAGGTDVGGSAYYAGDESELLEKLNELFLEILNRTSSGTATALSMNNLNGEGMSVRAAFQPYRTDGTHGVTWTGDLQALFIDSQGMLREDDGDAVLESASADKIIDMCFDEDAGVLRVKKSTAVSGRPTDAQTSACSVSVFNQLAGDINYLWDGGGWLAGLSDANLTSQRGYASTTGGRYIITGIDADSDNLVQSDEQAAFVASTFTDTNAGLLQVADAAAAAPVVNWIRGVDGALRSRQVEVGGTVSTWRLGDIIYSSPAVVGRPAEAWDLIYQDSSYSGFFQAYKDRRQVVYAGANDGMLHAFNAGWYDKANSRFLRGKASTTQFDLGAELWAYVPYNLLAHVPYLSSSSYGDDDGDHIYSVDLRPRVFDARIFGDDGVAGQSGVTHTNGWGTVLVVGMRFGGGEIGVDVNPTDPGADTRTLRSGYAIFDITDPEVAPQLLLEFSHANLGYSTAVPTPLAVGGNWYLLLGSGPYPADATALGAASSSQNGRLFLLNLKTMALESTFGSSGVVTLGDANSFVSDLLSVDYDLDGSADAVYFGTVAGSAGSWTGKLYRVRVQNTQGSGATASTYYTPASWSVSAVYDAGKPITAMPNVTLDRSGNRWLLVGSGRFLVKPDATDTATQTFFGIKEPRNSAGAFTWGTAASLVDTSSASVFEITGNLTGVTTTPSVSSFAALDSLLQDYSDSTNYKGGWKRNFAATRERGVGEAAVLGGTLLYTGFQPSVAACETEGQSNLYALYYGTGTAYWEPVIGLGSGTDANGNYEVEKSVSLGTGLTVTPSLHSGAGGDTKKQINVFNQTSTGTTVSVQAEGPKTVRPGERSWREHGQ